MKKFILSFAMACSTSAFSDMPYISNNTAENFERVTSGDITCESRRATPTLNTGMYSAQEDSTYTSKTSNDKGVYVSLSIPLNYKQNPVDCRGLYDTALQKEQLRVKQLEQQVELLKSRRFSTD